MRKLLGIVASLALGLSLYSTADASRIHGSVEIRVSPPVVVTPIRHRTYYSPYYYYYEDDYYWRHHKHHNKHWDRHRHHRDRDWRDGRRR